MSRSRPSRAPRRQGRAAARQKPAGRPRQSAPKVPAPQPATGRRVALVLPQGGAPITERELRLRAVPFTPTRTLELRGQSVMVGTLPGAALGQLYRLRTVEDVFAVLIDGVKLAGHGDLKRLGGPELSARIDQALKFKGGGMRPGHQPSFWAFVKQDRDQELHRRDIGAAIMAAIHDGHRRWRARDPAEIEFWAFHVRRRLTLGLRLTRIGFRQRDYKASERAGSLRPPLAAALALLSDPIAEETVLDPMCGVGTVLIERAALAPAGEVIGRDIDAAALDLATANAKRAGCAVALARGDATTPDCFAELAGRIDSLICNLPFGRRFAAGQDLEGLYRAALATWRPLLAPNGRMTLLTPEKAALTRAAAATGLSCRAQATLFVQGIAAGVFQLRRN